MRRSCVMHARALVLLCLDLDYLLYTMPTICAVSVRASASSALHTTHYTRHTCTLHAGVDERSAQAQPPPRARAEAEAGRAKQLKRTVSS